MTNEISNITNSNRITSVDFLRACALFGIIILHSMNGWGMWYEALYDCRIDETIMFFIQRFLQERCVTIFSILFGLSFFFINRHNYSTRKFIWRCSILVLIGCVNKIFYTWDILAWYGINGIILCLFKKCKSKNLLYFSIVCFISTSVISTFHLEKLITLTHEARYYPNNTLTHIFFMWSFSFVEYSREAVCKFGFDTLGYFLIGYYVGRSELYKRFGNIGFIHIALMVSFYAVALGLHKFINQGHLITTLVTLNGALTYSAIILYLYHNFSMKYLYRILESYGRMGLTNYTLQGIFGVVMLNLFTPPIVNLTQYKIVLFFCSFFFIQALVSHYWLRKYKYGPLEYLWRYYTNILS